MTKVKDNTQTFGIVFFILFVVAFGTSITLNFQLQNKIDVLEADSVGCATTMEEAHDAMELKHELQTDIEEYNIHSVKSGKLAPIVLKYAEEHHVDPKLILAQIYVESEFNVGATSEVGARGLLQVMPFWTKVAHFQNNTGIEDKKELYSMEESVNAGAYIQSHYIQLCGGLEAGLRCYHGGPAAKYNPKPDTVAYVKKVMKYYRA